MVENLADLICYECDLTLVQKGRLGQSSLNAFCFGVKVWQYILQGHCRALRQFIIHDRDGTLDQPLMDCLVVLQHDMANIVKRYVFHIYHNIAHDLASCWDLKAVDLRCADCRVHAAFSTYCGEYNLLSDLLQKA